MNHYDVRKTARGEWYSAIGTTFVVAVFAQCDSLNKRLTKAESTLFFKKICFLKDRKSMRDGAILLYTKFFYLSVSHSRLERREKNGVVGRRKL
jgi:hypothetical protein